MAEAKRQLWTAAEYFADPRISRSSLWDFDDEGPRIYYGRYVARTLPGRKQTREMLLGTMTHMFVLEPDEYRCRLFVKPATLNRRSNAGKAELDAIEREGRIALPEEDVRLVTAMREAVMAHPLARKMVERSEHEVTLTWRDTDDQLAAPLDCRCRIDMLDVGTRGAVIGDLKTSEDPAPEAFARHGARLGYHWQPPFYSAPVMELFGTVPNFCFVVVRNTPPHEVVVWHVHRDDVEAAAVQVRRALRRLSTHIASDTWTAPWESPRALEFHFPRWALQEDFHR